VPVAVDADARDVVGVRRRRRDLLLSRTTRRRPITSTAS
jgi:hypothetical protein